MKEQLRLLIELQKYDARLQELEAAVRALPEKLAPVKQDLARLEALLAAEKDELARTEAWRREQDAVLKQEAESIAKAKAKIQASKNSKDYNAANRELEAKRRTMSEREDEVLKVIEAIEATRKQIAEHEKDVQTLRNHLEDDEKEIAEKLAELSGQVEAARADRDRVAAGVDKQMLSRYQLVVKRRGIAVVPVVSGSCGGCHMQVPPQLVNILARGESIETCPRCQRLLYRQEMLEGGAEPSGQ